MIYICSLGMENRAALPEEWRGMRLMCRERREEPRLLLTASPLLSPENPTVAQMG